MLNERNFLGVKTLNRGCRKDCAVSLCWCKMQVEDGLWHIGEIIQTTDRPLQIFLVPLDYLPVHK